MRLCIVLGCLALAGTPLSADPATLINTLADRPVFNVVNDGVTMSRSLAPGNRIAVPAGFFSGLGEKRVPLTAGSTYYLARFGALPGLYRLGSNQVIILNQSGRAVPLAFDGPGASAVLAAGNLAIGALANGALHVSWNDGEGNGLSADLTQAGVYRLVLGSPDGLGRTVSLVRWD